MFGKMYLALDLQPTIELGSKSPLHMTLTPPVKVEDEVLRRLQENIAEKVQDFGSVVVRGLGDDYFGPNTPPVRVRKIERTDKLIELHQLAIAEVELAVPDVDTTYTGEHWQPHATYKGTLGLGEGEERVISELTILRKIADIWDRPAVISLESE